MTFQNNKDKENLKSTRRKVTYKGLGSRMVLDFSTVELEARGQWSNILRLLSENNFQTRLKLPSIRE